MTAIQNIVTTTATIAIEEVQRGTTPDALIGHNRLDLCGKGD